MNRHIITWAALAFVAALALSPFLFGDARAYNKPMSTGVTLLERVDRTPERVGPYGQQCNVTIINTDQDGGVLYVGYPQPDAAILPGTAGIPLGKCSFCVGTYISEDAVPSALYVKSGNPDAGVTALFHLSGGCQ